MRVEANARGLRSVAAALAAAAAVFESRVIVSLALLESTSATREIDDKLYAIELAYYRRADALVRAKKRGAQRPRRGAKLG